MKLLTKVTMALVLTAAGHLAKAQVTAGDCASAVNICTNASFAVDPSGFGAVDELAGNSISNPQTNPNLNNLGVPNAGCLLSGELNSTWMVINVATTGVLEFSFGAPGTGNCYDWIMWQYGPTTCADIQANNLPPVACNWNGNCDGFTGMATSANIAAQGGSEPDFEAPLNVTCGDQFIICFSNFSSATTNVPLNFFGSAQVSCTTFTPINVNDPTICEQAACATLTATGGTSYTWTANPDLSATTGATVNACPPGPGVYEYYVTGTGPCGTGTDTATVTVLPSTDPACSTPCAFTFISTNVSACDPATGTFDITGQVDFTNAPATGQLVIQTCSGDQVTFNAPFTSPQVYAINGIIADGTPGCTVTAFFTDDMACTITGPAFTEPTCPCNMDFFSVNFSACDPNTDTFDAFGDIQFTSPPPGGTLVVTMDDGTNTYDTIINPPFTSPYTWSISNLPSNGANFTITVQFTNNPACSQTINLTAPTSCACPADAGTYNVTMTGSGNTNYVLCENDQIDFVHNNDHTPPLDLNDPVTPYNPGIWWLIYSCPPTPGIDILTDPCFLGVISQNANWSDINDLLVINSFPAGTFTNNTVYYVPITMYDVNSGTYSLYPPPNLCFDLGQTTAVTYLPPITFTSVEDCQAGTVTVTLNGGHPEIFGTNFTASNLQPGNASFVNTTTGNGGTIVISGLLDGDMYSFDVVDQNGCPLTVTGGPFVGPDDATITPAGPFCPGDPAFQMTAVDPGGTWTANCGACITAGGLFNPATAGPGTWDITYTIPGACGSTDTEQVIVNPAFDPTITPAGPFCADDPPTNLAAIDPGGTWSGNGIVDAINGTFDPSFAGAGTHTITYTITGACGATDTEDIVVIPVDDATINPAGPFCNTDPVFTMTAADPNGVWSATCGPCINAATGDFDPAAAGNGTHTITYTIAGACGDTDTENVVVTNQLDATVTPAGPFCESDPAFIMTAVDPGGTWTATCGACIDAVTGSFDPAAAGAGSWTVTYTIGGNCGDVQNTVVDVNPDMDATITPAGPLCIGNASIFLTAVDPGGTWTGNGIVDAVNGEFDPNVAGPGLHTITYTIGPPCGDTKTIDILVHDPLAVVALSDQTICEGDNAAISATASGGDGNYTYNWTDDQGNFVGTGTNLTVTPATTTTYTVTVTDACATTPASASVTITVEPIPAINFVADRTTGCTPLTVTFTDFTVPAGTNCLWDFGDGTTSTDCGTTTHTFVTPGCYDITLTITTAAGCSATMTQANMVCVFDWAVADFTSSPDSTTVFDPIFDFTNLSTNATSYVWDFGDGNTSTESDPTHIYASTPGTYNVCLEAINVNGCNDTVCHEVKILDEFLIFVPNAFTPDNDNFNNDFGPVISGHIPESYEFFIFDRWGHIIFESHHVSNRWDGSYATSSEIAKEDVYVWKLNVRSAIDGEKKTYYGHVTLLK